jgi:hypothetical protein
MPNVPRVADEIAARLERERLFFLSEEARSEIDAFFYGPAQSQHHIGDLAVEQGRALSYLHAAEFALSPAFADPGAFAMPPNNVIEVPVGAARLGLLKGNCSLIFWTHAPDGSAIQSLTAPDLAVFGGDISKMQRLQPESAQFTPQNDTLHSLASQFQYLHDATGWEPAIRVAESGALRLQVLLWALKRAVIEESPGAAIDRALQEFGPTYA